MTRCVVDAVVDAGVCAILSKGWSDRGSKKEEEDEDGQKDGADGVKYPDEIFPIDSIDHSWLFTRIDAACHHGGAGTTGASLRAGIVSPGEGSALSLPLSGARQLRRPAECFELIV